jgi:hypothetical protein
MPVFNKSLKTKKGKTSAYLLGGLRGKAKPVTPLWSLKNE